jgi:hypothetical protein
VAGVKSCPWCDQEVGSARGLLCPHCGQHLTRGPSRAARPAAAAAVAEAEPSASSPSVAPVEAEAGPTRRCQAPGCGNELPPGAGVCQYCGAPAPLEAAAVSGAVTIVCPWGPVQLAPGAPVDLGRDSGFSRLAGELDRFDNISRRHARIELQADGVYVTDFGSTNGTYIDGRRITPNRPERADASSTVRLASNVTLRLAAPAERGAA